jgi:hypothetical protein
MAILSLFFLNVVDQGVIIFYVFFVRVWLGLWRLGLGRLRLGRFWLRRLGLRWLGLWWLGLWRLRFRFGIRLRGRRLWLRFRRLRLWGRRNVMCHVAFMAFNA